MRKLYKWLIPAVGDMRASPASSKSNWPSKSLETLGRCPVCNATQRHVLYSGLADKIFRTAPGRWTLYECLGCNCAYLDPRPNRDSIGLAYTQYFTHKPIPQSHQLPLHAWLRHALVNDYRNERFGTQLNPALGLGAPLLKMFPSLCRRVTLEARGFRPPQPGSPRRLLEVGCGNGRFLALAAAMGWDVLGLEPDPQAVAAARSLGVKIVEGGLEVLDPDQEAFDAVVHSHVIEHVHDPRKMLLQCHRLLRPGGLLWLETPNLAALGHMRFGQVWYGLDPPRHLVLFSREGLVGLLRDTGFEDIQPNQWRPLAKRLFACSDAISRNLNVDTHSRLRLRLQWAAYQAERREKAEIGVREYISLTARKMTNKQYSRSLECDVIMTESL